MHYPHKILALGPVLSSVQEITPLTTRLLSTWHYHCESSPIPYDKTAPDSHKYLDKNDQPELTDLPIGSYIDYLQTVKS